MMCYCCKSEGLQSKSKRTPGPVIKFCNYLSSPQSWSHLSFRRILSITLLSIPEVQHHLLLYSARRIVVRERCQQRGRWPKYKQTSSCPAEISQAEFN